MPGWPRATPSGPGNDRVGRAARVKTRGGRREAPPDLESEKIQALRRIRKGLDEHDWSNLEPPEPGTDSVIYRWAHHARGICLLVEEMQKDTEVSAALRAELAASLRSVAGALVQQPPNDPGLDDTREQQQYGGMRLPIGAPAGVLCRASRAGNPSSPGREVRPPLDASKCRNPPPRTATVSSQGCRGPFRAEPRFAGRKWRPRCELRAGRRPAPGDRRYLEVHAQAVRAADDEEGQR